MVAPSIIHFVDIRGKAPFNRLPFPFPIESLVGLPLGIWFSTCPARNIKVGSNADVPGPNQFGDVVEVIQQVIQRGAGLVTDEPVEAGKPHLTPPLRAKALIWSSVLLRGWSQRALQFVWE